MKLYKYILVLILLGVLSTLNASHIKWHWDYEKALLTAKKENKNLMLILRKKDCIDCQKMFEITFLNQDYITELNEKFISVIATYEDENSYPIEMFYSLEFPSLFFVSQEDESFLIDPLFGFVSPDKLSTKINTIQK